MCVSWCRLSQDLAKDLASLAREIHDVAGEADLPSSPSPEAAPEASTPEASAPAASTAHHSQVPPCCSVILCPFGSPCLVAEMWLLCGVAGKYRPFLDSEH